MHMEMEIQNRTIRKLHAFMGHLPHAYADVHLACTTTIHLYIFITQQLYMVSMSIEVHAYTAIGTGCKVQEWSANGPQGVPCKVSLGPTMHIGGGKISNICPMHQPRALVSHTEGQRWQRPVVHSSKVICDNSLQ